jgi:hypothetical protein
MKIKEIYGHSGLSYRAYHVCIDLGIETLEDLRRYRDKNNSFLTARKCGKKTNDELINLLEKTIVAKSSDDNASQLYSQSKYNTTIKAVFDRFDLSVRAYNVCQTLNLSTLGDLNRYFIENGNFLAAKNCGEKTSKELISLIEEDDLQTAIPFPKAAYRLDSQDESIYNILVEEAFCQLSVRCKNALSNVFDAELPTYDSIKRHFIDNNLTGNRLSNVGKLTNTEVESFKNYCRSLLKKFEGANFSSIEKNMISLSYCCGFRVTDESFITEFSENKLSLIAFTSAFFKDIFNFNEVDLFIAKNLFRLLDKKYSLDSIGKRFNLTRERIRQKAIKIFEKLDSKKSTIASLVPYTSYPDINTPIYIIDDIEMSSPLDKDILTTSPLFTAYILSICNPEYYLFSSLDKFRRPDEVDMLDVYEEVKKVKNCYLIKSKYLPKNKLAKAYEKLIVKSCERNPIEQRLAWHSVINFKLNPNSAKILCTIAAREFKLTADENTIIFERNTGKKVYEYALEALESLDRPSHISEICAEIKRNNPEFDSTAVSSSMRVHKNIFIYFGRSSTYGLKVWEHKQKNIKGGTIRSIIEEYLINHHEPKHLTDVLNYVRRFRDTNYNSVLSNLKLDTKGKFRFYGGGYVGLTSKTYTESTFGVEVKSANEVDWEKIIDLVF